jgi:DNA polymerase I
MNINPNSPEAYQLMHDGVLAFARAEQQGIRVDMEYAEKKKNHLTRKIERMEKLFKQTNFYRHWQHSIGGKNPNIHSNNQLARYLYKVKKLEPVSLTTSGQGSTDVEALEQLNIPDLSELLAIRKLKKVKDTYLEAFIREQVNGYIHPSFNLHLVKTYRGSSDRPNFQNIPKRDKEAMDICRKALFPRPGHQLMEVDYGQLEVRIATAYHKDPVMIKYNKDSSTCMHRDMAIQLFLLDSYDKKDPQHKLLRAATKNSFVFPQFYGDWYKPNALSLAGKWGGLSEGKWKPGQGIELNGACLSDHFLSKGIKSMNDFINHVKEIEYDFWNNRFKVYQKWKTKHWKEYQRNGYVDMLTGFRCSGLMDRKNVSNYPVQGAAFHCLLWAFIRLDTIMRKEGWKTKLIGQIHDAIVLDVHPDELEYVAETIQRVTCEDLPKAWKWINVPLEVEAEVGNVDCSWAELEPYVLP